MRLTCCRIGTVLLLSIVVLGCEPAKPVASTPGAPPLPPPPPGAESPAATEPAASPAGAPSEPPLPPETKFGAFAGGIDELAARPAAPAQAAAIPPAEIESTERVKAEKGVGIKGRSLDQYEGLIVTPAKAFFSTKERIAFEIEVPHALNLYKATEGQGPRTHDEFMEKIIQFNKIKLPQLPPGHKYVYDVEQELLMVERPKQR